jgi:hypothetical protein
LKSTRFTEEYQRFALSDVQAIVVTALPDRTVSQVAAAGAAILWTLGMLAVSSTYAKAFFAVTGVLALAWVIVDIARGQRCRCYLHTAVSRELLVPVSRLRTARMFLTQVQPAIEAVQGRLSPEEIAALEQPGGPAPVDQPPEVPSAPGYLPEAVFALFLIDALLVLIDQRYPKLESGNILITTFFAEAVLVVVALIRRGARDPRRIIYGVMIVAILCMGWDLVGLTRSLGTWLTLIMDSAKKSRPPQPQPVFGWAWSHGAAVFAAGWRMVAGPLGLALAYFERRTGHK